MWRETASRYDCEGFGLTIWERCFWVNNVGWVQGAVLLTVWLGPLVWFVRRDRVRVTRPVLPGDRPRRFILPTVWGVTTVAIYVWFLFVGWIVGMLLAFKVVEPLWMRMLGYR